MINRNAYSQASNQKYLIVTFEKTTKIKIPIHGKQLFYWVVKLDSVNKMPLNMFPLYLSGYSKDNMERCKQSKVIDIFVMNTSSDFDFEDKYLNEIEIFRNIIKHNRRKVQVFEKKISEHVTEIVKIFITPINGNFCNCLIYKNSGERINYKGLIYLPLDQFSYNKDFWHSPDLKTVSSYDFSKMYYKNRPLYDMH